MPYISPDAQKKFSLLGESIKLMPKMEGAGELNFNLTTVIIAYLNQNGHRYQTMNDIVGALASSCREFQRRIVDPYEKQKAYEADLKDTDPYPYTG